MFRTPGTANEQQWTFRRVAFYNWKYIVDPLGTNNCSEVVFDECGNYGMQNDGSWLYIRSAGTSDQFLNYWWTKCKHWSTSAPLIDAAAGGHFHVKQLDFSDWGAGAVVSPATPADGSFLVKLRGNNHSLGVCHASFDVLRGEIKSDSGKLMYSEWGGYGQVSFRDVDLTSQSSVRTYGPAMVYIAFPNANGAKYSFRDSQLAGGVTVEYAINSWQYRNEVTFNDTTWADKNGPSDVVTYVMTGAHGNANPPLVRFQGCGGKNAAYNFTSATAMPVWDATIGLVSIPSVSYQRTVTSMQKRELVLSGVYGNVTSGSTYARLPLGALITDFIVMAPAGGTAEADGGTWTLEADKAGTPATVATVTVAGALSAGFSQGGPLAIPYKCNTAAKCIVAVTPSTVSTAGDAYTIIRGYW